MKKFFTTMLIAAASIFAASQMASAASLTVCTGAPGGNYAYVGKVLANQMKGTLDVSVVNTAGSWENLQKVQSGDCDGALVQSDAIYLWGKEQGSLDYFKIADLYTEYTHLLCNRKSPVKEFSDLNEKTKVFSGGNGSGANVTLRGLIQADKDNGYASFTKVPLLNEQNQDVALIKVKAGVADCLFYVGSKGNKLMSVNAEKISSDVVLVPVVDKYFKRTVIKDKNGNETSIWKPTTMPGNTYNKIMPSGWFGNKGLDTIGVTSQMIVSSAWVNANPDAFAALGLAIGDVVNIVRSDKGLELETD